VFREGLTAAMSIVELILRTDRNIFSTPKPDIILE